MAKQKWTLIDGCRVGFFSMYTYDDAIGVVIVIVRFQSPGEERTFWAMEMDRFQCLELGFSNACPCLKLEWTLFAPFVTLTRL